MTISETRLFQIAQRFAELEARLASGQLEGPDFVTASRDYAELEPVAKAAASVTAMRGELSSLAAMGDGDPELRAMVNDFLKSKNIGLQVHTMHFVSAAAGDFHCCKIGDHIECGPQCG